MGFCFAGFSVLGFMGLSARLLLSEYSFSSRAHSQIFIPCFWLSVISSLCDRVTKVFTPRERYNKTTCVYLTSKKKKEALPKTVEYQLGTISSNWAFEGALDTELCEGLSSFVQDSTIPRGKTYWSFVTSTVRQEKISLSNMTHFPSWWIHQEAILCDL